MKKVLLVSILVLFSTQSFARDVRVSLEKLPDHSSKSICVSVQNVDREAVSGTLTFKVTGTKAMKAIKTNLLAGGIDTSVCAQFADDEVPNDRVAVVIVQYRDQNNEVLDSDNKMFSTSLPGMAKPQNAPAGSSSNNPIKSQSFSWNKDALTVINRISTITSCMRHEECGAGAIDSLDYECSREKVSSISKLIEEKIPNSKYLIDALGFQCSGEVSLCSGTTFVDAGCVMSNLKFVVGELSHL